MTGLSVNEASDLPTITYLSMDPLTSTVGSSQVLSYVERLALRGVDVNLITFEHDPSLVLHRRLLDLGVTWQPQRYGRHGAVGGLSRVLRAAWLVRGAAIVHARSDMPAASVMLAGVKHWVWDVRGLWIDQKVASGVVRSGSPQERVMRWVERKAACRSTAVISITASGVDALDERYRGLVSPKAQVVTTCADLDRFTSTPLPLAPVRVLLAGTLNRYYDTPIMLDLVAELRRRQAVELIVASPDGTAWEDELAAVDVVRLSATPAQMADLMSSCHVGLSVCRDDAGASLRAAMPTKIGELLASGRPVVVNPGLVDAAELLVRHECGVVFGSSTVLDLEWAVDQLEFLLNDPSTPDRCRSLAESHFDLGAGIDRLIAVYGSLKT